jgi:hypothetical protein
MIEKLRMWSIGSGKPRRVHDKAAKPFQRDITSHANGPSRAPLEGPQGPYGELKKRHVNRDAPSNKNVWQLLCWTFILAIAIGREPAPMLDFRTLPGTNEENVSTVCQQSVRASWGQLQSNQVASLPNRIIARNAFDLHLADSESVTAEGDRRRRRFCLAVSQPPLEHVHPCRPATHSTSRKDQCV